MRRLLHDLALRSVPREWRADVARDLSDECPGGTAWVAAQALRIGVRLRLQHLTETARRLPGRVPRRSPMKDFGRDITLAIRGAARRPSYSLAVIATLAIGIGANTAIFSVFNWIMFRPLPGVGAPGELATIQFQTPKRNGSYFLSYRDYADLRDGMSTTVAGIALAAPLKMDLTVGADTSRIDTELVSVNYLSLFGVRPMLGRDFTTTEEFAGGGTPVVISERLWRRSFAADRSAIGRAVRLNGRPFTIVGVVPAPFQGRATVTRADLWLTLSGYATTLPPSIAPTALTENRRQTMFGDAFARLRPDVTLAQAQAEADAAVAASPDFASTRSSPGQRSAIGPVFYEGVGLDQFVQERLVTVFRLLMAAVGLLLLLACANAANLLLARSTARRREIAVCQAIGASRFRIVRQQLAEGLVLSLAAGLAGILIAHWITWLFDGMHIVTVLPALERVEIDWRVLVFAMAASVVTALAFASAPAILSSRVDLQSSLKSGQHGSRGGRRVLRSSLVALQITVSVLLLITAGAFVRTLHNIRAIDLGLRHDQVFTFGVNPQRFGLDDKRSIAYMRDLLDRVRTLPGVGSAAFTWTTSFANRRNDVRFRRHDRPDTDYVSAQTTVSPGFFETMGIPLLAGRDFSPADVETPSDAGGVIILSRKTAEQVFPDGSALGSRLVLDYPKGKVVEVVGIAGDVRGRAVTSAPEPWAYAPAAQPAWGTILLRTELPTEQVVAAVREAGRAINPVVAPHDLETFDATVERALSEQRLFAKASAAFAAVAALLAGVGIYGMVACSVAERLKEFGIRLALGASGSRVLALVFRSAVVVSACGLLGGVLGAAGLQRFIASRLYGVSALDPLTITAVVASILGISIVASLVPAIRAAHVDPVRSLRVE